MPRTNLSSKFPPSPEKPNIPEIQEGVIEEIRVRVPGTVFEVDQDGYVRVPLDLLQRMLDNRS